MKKSQETLQLQNRIEELEETLGLNIKLEFILDESIEKLSQNERKKYVSDIALFYGSVFKDRLKEFIGEQLEDLAKIGGTELRSNIIRSNINCFRLIDKWMEKRTNEHFGNLQTIRESFDENKDFINKIKKDTDI